MNDDQGTIAARTDVKGELDVRTYPQDLLTMARKCLDEGKFGLAVVVCHVACEVATARSLSAAFARAASARGIAGVGEAVEAFLTSLNGYNLATKRNRNLYTALTGDQIAQQPFWEKFKASAICRNRILHGRLAAGQVQQKDADESFNAASAFVAHLKQ
jgi:hypothetical protein